MNIDKKCRLCCNINSDCSHSLYDSGGGCTQVYEIAVKYFDPMLLVVDNTNSCGNQSTIICQGCWKHINDFHEFQQHILLSQAKFLVDIKPYLEDVKEECTSIYNDTKKHGTVHCTNDCVEEGYDAYVMPLTNLVEDNNEISTVLEQSNNKSPFDLEQHVELVLNELKKESEPKEGHKNLIDENFESDNDIDRDTLKDDLEDDNHCSSDDIPIGQIISRKNYKQSQFDLKRNCRKIRKRKDAVQRKSGDKKNKPKRNASHEKVASKSKAYNSAEKIQELDKFIADVKPQLECDLCKCIFQNYNSLRSHFSDEHHEKCYIVCCDKKIFRRYLLVEHLRLHVNPETYKCDICGAISASSRTLNAHKRFMHNTAKTLECEVCHRKFKGKPTLIRHMATHATSSKDIKCPQCDRCFVFEFQLKLHMNNVHSVIKICDQCGKTVHGAAALKQHLLQHSETKQTKWPCDQCDAQLASLWGLKSHKLSFHPDGTTAFICKDCGKVASSEITLKRHKRLVHQIERKYKCTYCEKTFKKNSHLKDHIAIHTGQHIHKCTLCSQTFINSGSLHKHRKKFHPVEWKEARQHRIDLPKVNAENVIREVLL